MALQPAYTAVAARQTLSKPPQPAPAPSQSIWTPDVRLYVQRALGFEVPGIASQETQAKLKTVITSAAEAGQIATIDWSTFPLPQQLILQERTALSTSTSSVHASVTNGILPINGMSHTNSTLGKRKSTDMEPTQDTGVKTPPWKKQQNTKPLEDRISGKPQPTKKQKKAALNSNGLNTQADALERRRQRFGVVPATSSTSHADPNVIPTGPVIGTCQTLEKNYFRLTAAPKPAEVRPLPVLKDMMNLLRRKWKQEHNYVYACDQFKSMRQDLTVQHVQNDFTVSVYEAHARLALEMGDLGEYNQCQTQLRSLYKKKLAGKPEEFTAYRILYLIYTCNRTDMNNALADLTEADKNMEGVKHALKVRAAVAAGNYHRFFKLYQDTPFMGAYLLDKCIPRQRLAALAAICKTYKPDVPLSFLVDELAFQDGEEDPDHGARACVQFICDYGGEHLIQKKETGEVRFASGRAGQLFEKARSDAFSRVDIKGQI